MAANHFASTAKAFDISRINGNVLKVEYAVRGELAIRAEELRKQLRQKPITFFRQVSALLDYPDLLEDPEKLPLAKGLFSNDAIERAKKYLAAVGSVGAYSHSQGIPIVREEVAQFITSRDGFPSDPNDIFLTAGYVFKHEDVTYGISASPGVQVVLQTLISNSNIGIMIPIPQYPLYTASIALFNGRPVPYYLDEENDWGLSTSELRNALSKARANGVDVKALCVINPGNPTGQCLSAENMGEVGIDPQVKEQFYKLASVSLCPPVSGQIMVGLMTNPPKPGDESYSLYESEILGIYAEVLNELEGVSCNPAQGAMYLFPRIDLPKKAVDAATKLGRAPDDFYCMELLNATGVCVVPGSGFLQKDGTYHFRSTFLAPEDQMDEFAKNLRDFHSEFMRKYK
ncbi:hypothetical protein HDU96_007905 [Phlyctochytrium bullatum]|nr:hypothetical protein HDU96_007905 [Phlyctochytrium bullatum]